jgi:hypothetical protein
MSQRIQSFQGRNQLSNVKYLNVSAMNRWLTITIPHLVVKELSTDLGTYLYYLGDTPESCLEPLSKGGKFNFTTTDVTNCIAMSRCTKKTDAMAIIATAMKSFIDTIERNYDPIGIWVLLERLSSIYPTSKLSIDTEHILTGVGPKGTPTKTVTFMKLDEGDKVSKQFFSVICTGNQLTSLSCKVSSVIEAIVEIADEESIKAFMRVVSNKIR